MAVEGSDMLNLGDEFARYSKAERELCEAAEPFLAAIQGIEAREGLCITEVRVTIDRTSSLYGSITANCTIVSAHNPTDFVHSTTPSGDGLSSELT